MSIIAPHPITVTTTTAAFREGFVQGKQGFYRAINVSNQVKEDVLVDMIRNLTEIAVEGWLSEELLRRDAGILVGILTNCVSVF
jgi:hypothetical protein